MDTTKIAYSVDEFCGLYSIGRSLAYEEIKTGRLKTRKAGRRTLILRADAEEWIMALPDGNSGAAA